VTILGAKRTLFLKLHFYPDSRNDATPSSRAGNPRTAGKTDTAFSTDIEPNTAKWQDCDCETADRIIGARVRDFSSGNNVFHYQPLLLLSQD
jgi:hypothetical protein